MSDKVFMVHLPKSAGTYISKMYGRGKNKNYLGSAHCFHIDGVSVKEHGVRRPFVAYTNKWKTENPGSVYSRIMKQNPTKFTVLRNPFDVLVSYYYSSSFGRSQDGWHGCRAWGKYKDFEDFILRYCDPEEKWNVAPLKENLYSQLVNDEGDVCVDYILRYERLENGLQFLEGEFNLERNADIDETKSSWRTICSTSRNKTPDREKDYRIYYTDRMRELLEKKCVFELGVGNYNFDGFKGPENFVVDHQHEKGKWVTLFNEA